MPALKQETVAQLTESLKGASGVYLADFTGITVEKVTALRGTLRKKGIRMRVAKNTLIRRALNDVGVQGLDKYLVGPTAVIIADGEDPIAPAKLLVDFLKTNEDAIKVKTVHMDGQAYDGGQLTAMSKMPGKRELQAQVVSIALGAGSNLLALFKGPGSKLASQIQALIEKREKETA
ncbi:MAG TPA: 50S ribosomal protein L10 [Fibrobacteres bacterium]|jgi:large subunit ribosomal protein L10|nr:50S ribosomal protein L10 [Fibrobacterota bacterium]